MSGCEEEGEEGVTTAVTAADRGWHFPGRDCLACHNYDLGAPQHLEIAGTIFKSAMPTNIDDLAKICNADLSIEFVDSGFNVIDSTANYYDANSKGYKGMGNVFLLQRLYNSVLNGSFYMRIVDKKSGLLMAQSTTLHPFSGGAYDLNSAVDFANRLSCNACHNGQTTSYLYVQNNSSLCQ